MSSMTPYLKLMADANASDMFFCTGISPHLKIEGEMRKMGHQAFKIGEIQELAYSFITEKQKKEFEKKMELNCTISVKGIGRYRVNIFRQRGEVSLVIHYTQPTVPQISDIGLPEILKDIIMEKEGLVLIVGATGSGKSTTLAAMIDYRNRSCISHVLMIEDHIEYVHQHNKSIIQQREIGDDTLSYENALKNVLREAPDVIAIGDIRDRTTMQHAIDYGKTGQLCVATLTARNASQALDRILGFFPDAIQSHILSDLSFNLRAIISQRLIPSIDGKRIVAVEVMFNTPTIAELIKRRDVTGIKRAMKNSQRAGCVTFEQALLKLYQEGKITLEETINNADSKNDISLAIRMSEDSD